VERPAGRLAFAVVIKVLLASDGGAASAAALRWVIDRVGHGPAEVKIVDVVDATAPDAAERGARVRGMARLLELVAPSLRVGVTEARGDHAALLARSRDAILVVGAHRGDRRAAPFVDLAVFGARGPVVVVPSEWICRQGPVLVGVGAEDEETDTLAFAESEAAAHGADVRMIHAWETTGTGELPPAWDFGTESIPERQGRALTRLAEGERESHPGLTVTAEAVQGHVVARLSNAARTASLLVVGRSHRNAVIRGVFGSTASGLLAALPCPVAVVP